MNLIARTAALVAAAALGAGAVAPQAASAAIGSSAPAATSAAVASTGPASAYPVHTTLRPGSKDPWVWELQTELVGIGYRLRATNVHDAQTKAAVVAFQRAQHLAADGVVGRTTWQRFGMAYYPALTVGARGAAVVRLQKLLHVAGYLTTTADGVYGKGTAGAVRRAQAAKHLPVTGIADVRLSLALESSIGC